MTVVRAAVIQAAPVAFDTGQTLDRVRVLAAEAATPAPDVGPAFAHRGIDLLVFPEAFVSAYPKGIDFGVRVGMRSPEGRAWFQRYWESAIEVPGPETEALGEVARAHGTHLVIGVIERCGGTLYCAALTFTADGALVARRRKLVPTALERVVWGAGDGSTLDVVSTAIGRIGAVICWENYMPLMRMALYAKGVELYCAPTVDDRDTWIPSMRHIAVEGRCFVLSSCQLARRSDYPADYPLDEDVDPTSLLIRGGSCIVDPFGEVLVGPVYGTTAILRAELDLSRIVRGKYDLDVAGHYARPDVFDLRVDETPRPAVRFGAFGTSQDEVSAARS